MSPSFAIGAAILVPLLGAVGVGLTGRTNDEGNNLRDGVTVVATLITFAIVLQLLPEVRGGGRPELELFQVLGVVRCDTFEHLHIYLEPPELTYL